MKFLRHLLAGGKIFLYSDGNGNPVDNPAYRLSGGNLPGMWYAHASLNRADTTRFDRFVLWMWWNDCGMRQIKSIWGRRVLAMLLLCLILAACTYGNERKVVCEGVERWPIKTLADGSAGAVLQEQPVETTIDALTIPKGKNKSEFLKADNIRWPEEEHQYRVQGTVVGVKREADEDFHIVLRSLHTKKTMVVEIPNGACTPVAFKALFESLQDQFVADVAKPVSKYKRLNKAQQKVIEVVGPGFWDIVHGQKGVAKNGFEVHPVISFKVVKP